MSDKLQENEIGKGKILGIALGQNRNGQLTLTIEVSVEKRVLGDREDDPTEDVTPFTVFTNLHLDEDGDVEGKRRSMARDILKRLTGVELKDDLSDEGYLRLTEEHPKSLVKEIEDKEVMVKCTGKYFNLYFPRVLPVRMTLADLKKHAKSKQIPY
jgi:hypothetical protein